MGLYKTEKCFFTGQQVIRQQELNGDCFDGYYYAIKFEGEVREIRLSIAREDDWQNDTWLKLHGETFLQLINKNKKWDIFRGGVSLDEVITVYNTMIVRSRTSH